MRARHRRVMTVALSLVTLSVGAWACVPTLDEEGRPCPCAPGFVCCEARGRCVAEGSACDGLSGNADATGPSTRCEDRRGGCDPLTTCAGAGSTKACGACPTGYTGHGDRGCVDLDECASPGRCAAGTSCVNTPGSFRCDGTTCPPGTHGCPSGCCSMTLTTLHPTDRGAYPHLRGSLKLDTGGRPHVAISSRGARRVSYVHFDGTRWLHRDVAHDEDWDYADGWDSVSLALDAQGTPHIAFRTESGARLARWTGAAFEVSTIDTNASSGVGLTLALGEGGAPHVAHYDERSTALVYSRRVGPDWVSETVGLTKVAPRGDDALALDELGHAHLCLAAPDRSVVVYARFDGQSWLREDAVAGSDCAIAVQRGTRAVTILSSDAYPRIAARRAEGGWTSQEYRLAVGSDPSLALGAQGAPHGLFQTGAGLRYFRRAPGGYEAGVLHAKTFLSVAALALGADDTLHVLFGDNDVLHYGR